MPYSTTFSLFLVAALICIVMPGPAGSYLPTNGLGSGSTGRPLAAVGSTARVSERVVAAVVGFAALLHASAVVFHEVKLVGAA